MLSSRRLVLATFLALMLVSLTRAQTPVTTSFTYQGELASSGTPASGLFDLRFRLFDAPSGGNQIGSTLCSDNLAVAGGRFAASLDFGAVFAGQKRWLEIEVRPDTGLGCDDATGYTVLSPRQELTATPNATFAQSSGAATSAANAAALNGQPAAFYTNSANLTGSIADARLSGNIARLDANQTFTGQLTFSNPANAFAGNGSGLTNLSGSAITQGTVGRSVFSSDVAAGVGTLSINWAATETLATAATDASPKSVAVSGRFAFVVNAGPGTLQIFDIASPTSPVLISTTQTAASPVGVAVAGSYAHVVCSSTRTLQIFDVSNPSTPVLIGSAATGDRPIAVAVAGPRTFVLNQSSPTPPFGTLQTFDTSSPGSPLLVSTAQTGAISSGLALSSSYAFVTCRLSGTLEIFDLQSPTATTPISSVQVGEGVTGVAVADGYAFVVKTAVLIVVDVRTPAAPAIVGSIGIGVIPSAVTISGTYAFVTEINNRTLRILDIRSPLSPALVTTVSTGDGPESIAVSGSTILVANGLSNTLQLLGGRRIVGFDGRLDSSVLTGVSGAGLTNLSGSAITQGSITRSTLNPELQATIGTAGVALDTPTSAVQVGSVYRALRVSGNRLYSVDSTSVRIYDITNASAPSLLGTFPNGSPFGGGRDIDISGQLAAVAGPASLTFINVANPAAPAPVGFAAPNFPTLPLERFAAVAISGNFAYAGFGQTIGYFRVYDITNPAAPALRSDIPVGFGPTAVAAVGSHAIMTDSSTESFRVFNVANPSAASQVTSLSLGAIRSLAISGSTAFALNASSLLLIDITDPAVPLLRSSTPVASEPMAVAVSGNLAYVASRLPGQVQVFDISNPAAPVLTFTASTGGEASEVTVSGSTLYLAENNPGKLKAFSIAPSVQTSRALTASSFFGSGSGLTNLSASSLTGTIDPARLPALDASLLTTGTLSTARLPTSIARTDTANTFGNFVNSFTGNVGIGTTTPSRPLSFGTTLTDKIALYDATNDFWGFGMTAGALQIKTGNNERMRITNSGVSIGTNANPTKALDIFGAGNINGLRLRGENNPSFSMGRGSTDEFEIGIASGFGNFSLSANAGDTILRTIASSPGKIHLQGGPNGAALTISGTQVGINTANPTNALTVSGNMNVTGSVAKAGGSFLIDHPLDPENKYLYHSFVESPDMMNIYNGNVTTDDKGYATITLPDYFEALNRDFRYQLTVIDESDDMEVFLWAKVVREVKDNQFTLRSSRGNLKVSWQVTGIRQDAWAQKNRIPNSVDKPAAEKGTLLHPEAFAK